MDEFTIWHCSLRWCRDTVFTTENLKGLTSNRIRVCAKGSDNSIYFVDENHTLIKVRSPNELEVIPNKNIITPSGLALYSSENNNDFTFLPVDKKIGYKRFIDSLKFDMGREILKLYVTGANNGYFFYFDQEGKVRVCNYEGTHYTAKKVSDSFMLQHTFKLNNLVFRQNGLSEAYFFQNTEERQKISVIGLPAIFSNVSKQQEPVLFSNKSGTFFYASGELYQYELRDNAIVATILFEDLPCTGVTNIMKERTTDDFLISTKSERFYQVKKKRFNVTNMTETGKKTSGKDTKINNNIVYAITFWDKEHLFASGYRTGINDTGGAQHFFSC